jgi:hypothetical protein
MNLISINGLILVCLGAIPVSVSLYWLFLSMQTYRWMHIKGSVKSSEIFEREPGTIRGAYPFYKISITYFYEYNGKKYVSHKIGILNNDFTFYKYDKAAKFLNKLIQNETINIWINPHNPEESILVQGCSHEKTKHILGYFFFGTLLVLSGIYL